MGEKHIVCIGAALIDESFICKKEPVMYSSNPSVYYRSAGGVARNVANHLAQLGNSVELISHFGNDADGHWLMKKCTDVGMGLSNSVVNDISTGHYAAILAPDGNLLIGTAAAHFENVITIELLNEKTSVLKSASLILIDCNLDTECLSWILDFCRKEKKACIVETVSVQKAIRLQNLDLSNVLLITPNKDELISLTNQSPDSDFEQLINSLIEKGIKYVWIRNGKQGSKIFSADEAHSVASTSINVIDVTGAGDAALAGWIHAFLRGKNIIECLNYGHILAELILQTKGAILEELNSELLESKINISNKTKV